MFFFTFYAWFFVDMHQIPQKSRIDLAVDWIDELAPDSEPKLISQLAPLRFQESNWNLRIGRCYETGSYKIYISSTWLLVSNFVMVSWWFQRLIPRAPMTSIFEGKLPKKRPFPIKTRVIWVLGMYNFHVGQFGCTTVTAKIKFHLHGKLFTTKVIRRNSLWTVIKTPLATGAQDRQVVWAGNGPAGGHCKLSHGRL